MIHRRSFITGLISLVAAPAIVRVASIMPVKVMEPGFDIERAWLDWAEKQVCPSWMPSTSYGYADLIQYQDGFLKVVPTWILKDLR